MALTKGKIKINNIEYDVKSCKVEIAGLEADDSGRTDDGVYHYNYIYNRGRTITIQLVPTTQETVAALLNAVAGKTYNLTYYDPIAGENSDEVTYYRVKDDKSEELMKLSTEKAFGIENICGQSVYVNYTDDEGEFSLGVLSLDDLNKGNFNPRKLRCYNEE